MGDPALTLAAALQEAAEFKAAQHFGSESAEYFVKVFITLRFSLVKKLG